MNNTSETDSAPPAPAAETALASASASASAEAGAGAGELLGIGAAAAQLRVSERALRYYQQLGLIHPACTPGGLRRYSADDIARVTRIRELQDLLGLNLDEIAIVLSREDRMAQIRLTYHDERTSPSERRQLIEESLSLQEGLRATVEAKRAALSDFLADLDARIARSRKLLDAADDAAS